MAHMMTDLIPQANSNAPDELAGPAGDQPRAPTSAALPTRSAEFLCCCRSKRSAGPRPWRPESSCLIPGLPHRARLDRASSGRVKDQVNDAFELLQGKAEGCDRRPAQPRQVRHQVSQEARAEPVRQRPSRPPQDGRRHPLQDQRSVLNRTSAARSGKAGRHRIGQGALPFRAESTRKPLRPGNP
jgi:hypothetical protein